MHKYHNKQTKQTNKQNKTKQNKQTNKTKQTNWCSAASSSHRQQSSNIKRCPDRGVARLCYLMYDIWRLVSDRWQVWLSVWRLSSPDLWPCTGHGTSHHPAQATDWGDELIARSGIIYNGIRVVYVGLKADLASRSSLYRLQHYVLWLDLSAP